MTVTEEFTRSAMANIATAETVDQLRMQLRFLSMKVETEISASPIRNCKPFDAADVLDLCTSLENLVQLIAAAGARLSDDEPVQQLKAVG